MNKNVVYNIDYKDLFNKIDDESIDFICIDPPYGKINGMKLSGQKNKVDWDVPIDWAEMFNIFNEKLKKGGTIAVFGQQPTYSQMILSNIKNFKYEIIWEKNNAAQGFHSDKMPLIYTENIAIFIKPGAKRTYINPNFKTEINKEEYFCRWYSQKLLNQIGKTRREIHSDLGHRKLEFFFHYVGSQFGIPTEISYNQLIEFYKINKYDFFIEYSQLKKIFFEEKRLGLNRHKLDSAKYNGTFKNILSVSKDYKPYLHPTQKPVELMEILIRTYSKVGDLVVDCFSGSGSTLIAARNMKRNYIGGELSEEYFNIIKERLKKK